MIAPPTGYEGDDLHQESAIPQEEPQILGEHAARAQ